MMQVPNPSCTACRQNCMTDIPISIRGKFRPSKRPPQRVGRCPGVSFTITTSGASETNGFACRKPNRAAFANFCLMTSSATMINSHGCPLFADGASLAASKHRSIDAEGTDSDRYFRTLRRFSAKCKKGAKSSLIRLFYAVIGLVDRHPEALILFSKK